MNGSVDFQAREPGVEFQVKFRVGAN